MSAALLLMLSAHAAAPLADTVASACGPVYDLTELQFTFVVTAEGVEKARRSHVWSPSTGTVAVTGGGKTIDLTTFGGTPHSETASDDDVAQAWAWFTNDSYWLLAPCKVGDSGVTAAAEGRDILTLRFDTVGLTPGDTYRMEVSPSGQVTGWSFLLQSGKAGSFDWTDHTQSGSLNLSLTRTAREGDFVIRFEDVSAK
ncbi:MAG: hypothetical protein ACI8RZ_001976 [Myxococcota bacterium]|jgi:hypothetical protein